MISAEDIETRVNQRDHSQLKAGEILIDKQLEEKWVGGHGAQVCVALPESYTSRIANKLAEMYRQAGGWEVRVQSGDQRDPGFFLHFSKTR